MFNYLRRNASNIFFMFSISCFLVGGSLVYKGVNIMKENTENYPQKTGALARIEEIDDEIKASISEKLTLEGRALYEEKDSMIDTLGGNKKYYSLLSKFGNLESKFRVEIERGRQMRELGIPIFLFGLLPGWLYLDYKRHSSNN